MGPQEGRARPPKAGDARPDVPAPARRKKAYYTCKDLAADVFGVDYDRMYRAGFLEKKYNLEGFPRPYQDNPKRWHIPGVDMWKSRFMPGAPRQAPANDDTPAEPQTVDEYRARLRDAYGPP